MAKDLIAFYKKGDQVSDLGKEDGHLINYIYAEDAIQQAGKMDHKAFAVVQHDPKFLPELVNGVLEMGVQSPSIEEPDLIRVPDIKKFAPASLKIDYEKLQSKIGDNTLIEKLNAKDVSVPLINGTELTLEDYKDPIIKAPIVIDRNLITTGTYAIAGGAPDYAGFSNFVADFGANLDDLTGQVEGAFTDAGAATFTEPMNAGKTLTFTSDSDPLGVPTAGHIISWNSSGNYIVNAQTAHSGLVVVEKLNFKRIAAATTTQFILGFIAPGVSAMQIKNCLANANGLKGYLFHLNDSDITVEMFNIKAWDGAKTAGTLGFFATSNTNSKYQNIFSYGMQYGFYAASFTGEFRNCVAHDNTNNFLSVATADGYNCAHTGAGAIGFSTESNSITSVVNGDFQSLDDTNAAFAIPTVGQQLDDAGTGTGLITDNNAGIETNARPNGGGNVSVGANEKLVAAGGFNTLLDGAGLNNKLLTGAGI